MPKSKWPQVCEAVEDGRIEHWLANGVLEKTIARNLGVAINTWEVYKSQHDELREAIKKGNRVIVNEVQDALVKRALGYDYTESHVTKKVLPDGTETVVEEVRRRHMPPDTGAAIFILKNKDREHWKNDPVLAELRERELELKRAMAESEGKLFE